MRKFISGPHKARSQLLRYFDSDQREIVYILAVIRAVCRLCSLSSSLVHVSEGRALDMSVFGEFMQLLDVVHDLRITNSLTLASLVVLVYDIFLTFSDEVKYVWRASWSFGKFLFFLNRYPIVVVSIILIASDMGVASGVRLCDTAYRLEGWSTLAFIVPVQLIFCLRTIALWERSGWVLSFLVLLLLGSTFPNPALRRPQACDSIIAVFIWLSERIGRFMLPQEPRLKELLGCYADISGWTSPKVIIPAVAALMTFDTVTLALTIWGTMRMRKAGEGSGSVVRVLLRDGIVFYVMVFVSSTANLILYASLKRQHAALIGALVPVLRTVMSVCASRLVLNLRGAIDLVRSEAGTRPWNMDTADMSLYAGSRASMKVTGIEPEMDAWEEDAGTEMHRRLGPAHAYEYRRAGTEQEPGSLTALELRSLYRPRSTTVVEIMTGVVTEIN